MPAGAADCAAYVARSTADAPRACAAAGTAHSAAASLPRRAADCDGTRSAGLRRRATGAAHAGLSARATNQTTRSATRVGRRAADTAYARLPRRAAHSAARLRQVAASAVDADATRLAAESCCAATLSRRTANAYIAIKDAARVGGRATAVATRDALACVGTRESGPKGGGCPSDAGGDQAEHPPSRDRAGDGNRQLIKQLHRHLPR